MKKIFLFFAIVIFGLNANANEAGNISADDALLKLKKGNEHFVKMHMKHPDESKHRRLEILKGQHPFVAILSCSDSRVPSEIIFDQGLGDIFVIRNAGNVLDEHIIGSIEYAVEHLGVNLIIIMGHEDCGAIKAALENSKDTPCIESLKKSIKPAILEAKKKNKITPETVAKTNAELGAKNIFELSDEIHYMVKEHGVKIMPAYYHLDSGLVEFLN